MQKAQQNNHGFTAFDKHFL